MTSTQIIEFLEENYNNTGFPYMPVIDITDHFGFYPKDILNTLYKQKKINIHDTAKGKSISLPRNEEDYFKKLK